MINPLTNYSLLLLPLLLLLLLLFAACPRWWAPCLCAATASWSIHQISKEVRHISAQQLAGGGWGGLLGCKLFWWSAFAESLLCCSFSFHLLSINHTGVMISTPTS